MGIKDFFLPTFTAEPEQITVDAAFTMAPFNNTASFNPFTFTPSTATRGQAMAIPTIARARNIICSTLAGLPLEVYSKMNGSHVAAPSVINQPDPRVPGSAIYAWLAEDIWLNGIGYGQVLEQYGDTGRVRAWTRVAPDRVTPKLNSLQTEIVGYQVDGSAVPVQGVGSLVVFYGLDEGLLNRAGRTIRAAHALEQAAESFAKEPVPLQVLKSNGTNLPAERITKLLESWRTARLNKSTAFLNADVELQALGIDPAKLQLNEARQYVALELARACNLPAYFVSAETTSMTYSNAISERKALIDFSMKYVLTAIEQRLSMPDFVSSTTTVRFSLDDFLRGDPLQRAQVYEILNRIGAMSVAQIQEEEDLIYNEESRL
jgi:HK97 family phage portal protein